MFSSNEKKATSRRRNIFLFIASIMLLTLFVLPGFQVGATGQTVNVWFSSEYNPKNAGWYTCNGTWENNLKYKLSQQTNLTVNAPDGASMTTININPGLAYQSVWGVGTSLEDSSVYNLMLMSSTARANCLQQLFTTQNSGINMNLARVCIGSSDFCAYPFYTYDDGAADPALANFSIQKDIDYNIINVLKQAQTLNPNLRYFGSPWSPPGWMKTSGSIIGGSIISTQVPLFAQYLRKFVQAYAAQGVPIDALTIQNEPQYSPADYPGCLMTSTDEANLVKALRTELDTNNLSNVNLMVYDHNFQGADTYVAGIFSDPAALSATEGVAFHDYSGLPTMMTTIHNSYPTKNIYLTERMLWGCAGADRIIQFFRNWARSYNAWVTILDSNVQPEQWSGTPDPTILIQSATNRDTYWRTGEFYIFGQFSRYIQRGAVRIDSNNGSTNNSITNVAFLNPDNTIVVIVVNQTHTTQKFKMLVDGGQITASLPAATVATYKWQR